MVSKSEFTEIVQEYLTAKYPEIEETYCKLIYKNNAELYGIVIKNDSSNISPVIYIDDFYDQILNGYPLDYICGQIGSIFEDSRQPQIDISWFTDIKKVKEMLSVKLISQNGNQQLLSEVPHFEYGDLAGIYQVDLGRNFTEAGASITIKNEHMKAWNISAEQLHQYAMQKMGSKEFTISSMADIFRNNFLGAGAFEINDSDLPDLQMYMLTSTDMRNGASGILNSNLLQSLSEKLGSDLIVLPSSIHEVILLPDRNFDFNELVEMVTDINQSVVNPEDRLSNNVYSYDSKEKVLCQGAEKKPMQIKICNMDQKLERISVLGKLKSHQSSLHTSDKDTQAKEHSQRQTER